MAKHRRDGREVEGGGLENRFPERGRGFESYSLRQKFCRIKITTPYLCGEMTELAEGARLLSECAPKGVPRVRIPLSPPENFAEVNSYL